MAALPSRSKAQNGKRRYRVWQHGALLRDDVLYPAGTELDLPPAIAATIGPCVEPID